MADLDRPQERFQLSLDGRQAVSAIVGALVILGGTFVLGLTVGRQLGERERAGKPGAPNADLLEALDAPPPSTGAGDAAPKLSYPELLTQERAPAARPSSARAAAPAADGQPPAATSGPTPGPASRPGGASFAIQVGAVQDLEEAQRIAGRFRAHRARILTVDIPGKGRWYRVKVGAFDTKAEAERYQRDLARETGARGFVTFYN